MSASVPELGAPVVAPAGAGSDVSDFPGWFRDRHGWIAAAVYLVAILYFDRAALQHMQSVCACSSSPDPTQWMWSWKWIPWAIEHGKNPFITSEIWYPGPFNLAAVTMAPVTAIPGVPLDALFGPIAAFNVLLFAAPVISGWSAYRLCRYLSAAPWASILAGYTYGFSSYELAHQLAHMNLVWAFAPPLTALIAARVMRGEVSRVSGSIQLSIVWVLEFGISTEIFFTELIIAAIAVIVGWLLVRPQWRRQIVSAVVVLVVAGAVTGVIWSYYIYESLRAPQASQGFPLIFPADLLSYVFPNDMFKLGGTKFAAIAGKFYTNDVTEQNNYLGLPLIAIFVAYAATLWRRRLTRVVVVVTFLAFVLSLGVKLTMAGNQTIALPYDLLEHLPLFDLLTPSRIGLFVAMGAAIAAAIWLAAAHGRLSRLRRWILALAAVAFLYPNLGFTSPAFNYRESSLTQPAFFTTGLYKHYIHRGEVVLPLPFSYGPGGLSLLWQADTNLYFKLASGYFRTGTPPSYAVNPLSLDLLTDTVPTGAAADLNQLTRSHDVSVILAQDGTATGFLDMITQAGWKLQADVGGIRVYRRPATG